MVHEAETDAGEADQVTDSPQEDLANLLSRLPGAGHDDDVARVVEIYEGVERRYRAAMMAGRPVISSSASANG